MLRNLRIHGLLSRQGNVRLRLMVGKVAVSDDNVGGIPAFNADLQGFAGE